ncbi:hypothetical protein CASFOL_008317 [Castilleja foliolosa]|uniref:Uncharacterized protein n=1 Tax=Castilleja foliolosa TaxID=1961234 RepID=A0ABD3E2S5_9LAMI
MASSSFLIEFELSTNYVAELPLRLADFGVLHRNEASGALNWFDSRFQRFYPVQNDVYNQSWDFRNPLSPSLVWSSKVNKLEFCSDGGGHWTIQPGPVCCIIFHLSDLSRCFSAIRAFSWIPSCLRIYDARR